MNTMRVGMTIHGHVGGRGGDLLVVANVAGIGPAADPASDEQPGCSSAFPGGDWGGLPLLSEPDGFGAVGVGSYPPDDLPVVAEQYRGLPSETEQLLGYLRGRPPDGNASPADAVHIAAVVLDRRHRKIVPFNGENTDAGQMVSRRVDAVAW